MWDDTNSMDFCDTFDCSSRTTEPSRLDDNACVDQENVVESLMKIEDLSLYENATPPASACAGPSQTHFKQPAIGHPLQDSYQNPQDSGYAASYETLETFYPNSFSSNSMCSMDELFEGVSRDEYLSQDLKELINSPTMLIEETLPRNQSYNTPVRPVIRELQEFIEDPIMLFESTLPQNQSYDTPVRPGNHRTMSLQLDENGPNISRTNYSFSDTSSKLKQSLGLTLENNEVFQEDCLLDNWSSKMLSMPATESIECALQKSSTERDLTGDFSKAVCLPLVSGRHQDLNSISAHTLVQLMIGNYDSCVDSYGVIDCRYPYEFEGGHIAGAANIYTREQCLELLNMTSIIGDRSKRNILIFHCEFSSERGPNMCRFLRKEDRQKNMNIYPALDYPEIYLLDGGYKDFYENYTELCIPTFYMPMNHPEHEQDLKKFRQMSKTSNADIRMRSSRKPGHYHSQS